MNALQGARDVAIIVLALESIVIGGLIAFLIIQIQRLMKMMREEIKPILESTNETVSTVRGTTAFLSEHLVSPLVDVASFLSGVKRMSQVVTGWPKNSGTSRQSGPQVAQEDVGAPQPPQTNSGVS